MKWKVYLLVALLAIVAAGCAPKSDITVIKNGLLFAGTGPEPVGNGLVAFQGDKIVYAGPGEGYEIPAGARILNAKGGMIMPGVIDAHTHGNTNQLPHLLEEKWVRTGVTTVRCMGVDGLITPDEFAALDQRHHSSEYVLPRITVAGPIITNWVERKTDLFAVVQDGQEARTLAEGLLEAGADHLKVIIFTEVDDQVREVLAALIEVARENDVRLTCDLREMSVVEAAVELGIDELAHTPLGVMTDELIASMVEKDMIMLSTLHVWQRLDEDNNYPANVRRFLDAGGTIALGTDYGSYGTAGPGMPMQEFTAMLEHGMTEEEILLAATANAAKALGLESDLGTLEAGKAADIIVVNGNPLEDISLMADLKYVVARGQIID